jgi:hypothetical protein
MRVAHRDSGFLFRTNGDDASQQFQNVLRKSDVRIVLLGQFGSQSCEVYPVMCFRPFVLTRTPMPEFAAKCRLSTYEYGDAQLALSQRIVHFTLFHSSTADVISQSAMNVFALFPSIWPMIRTACNSSISPAIQAYRLSPS